MLSDDDVERILVICAHPDDVDFGAAGTIAIWTDRGIDVTYCIVTDGDAGGFDPTIARDEIGSIRRREQTAAAKEVGVDNVVFLGYPDGLLQPTLELRRDLARVIRQVRPQRVVTQCPERNYQRVFGSHPDHLAAGEAALCAVYPDARNPFTFTELAGEGLEAWKVTEVWMMASPETDHAVDITDQFERKIRALQCHESQHPEPHALEERIRGWGMAIAARHGLPADRLAEAFQVVPT